jgi:hypothetical protein
MTRSEGTKKTLQKVAILEFHGLQLLLEIDDELILSTE